MKICKVNLNSAIWPNKCAYCNSESSEFIEAKSTALKKVGYFVFFLIKTSRVIKLRFPVCKKHKYKAAIASKISQRSQLNLILGVLSVFAALGPLGDIYRTINGTVQPDIGIRWGIFMYGFPAVYWALFFWAKNNSPILIEDTKKDEINLHFKNDDFGKSFIEINKLVM